MKFRAKLAIKLALLIGGNEYRKMLSDMIEGMVESIVTEKTQVVVLEGPR
jgi:hypothetical protein